MAMSAMVNSLPTAILQAAAFPLVTLAIGFSQALKDKGLLFAWILFAIGLVIAGMLCETGPRRTHVNFIWTYMFCLNILFLYCTMTFLRRMAEYSQYSRTLKLKLIFGTIVFLAHLYSGMYYFEFLLQGHAY